MSTKKVLITSNLYKPNIGGIENSLYYMARAYLDSGFEAHIVASSINGFSDDELLGYEEEDGIKIHRYRGAGIVSRFVNGVILYRKLNKCNTYYKVISRSHMPLLMLRVSGFANVIYILAGVSYKQNAIIGNFFSKKYIARIIPHYFHHFMQFLAVRLSVANYVFSNSMVSQVRRYLKYNGNVEIIKPGVDGNKFEVLNDFDRYTLRGSFNYDNDDVVLIGVGRFYGVKGFPYLIRSMSYLPTQFKLLLIGDGAERKFYEEMISKYKLNSRVKIIGPVEDTSTYYKLSDIYVLSSIHETLGQTVLEALFSGLPIVAFNNKCSGVLTAIDEITDMSNCVLAEDLSAESLASAITQAEGLLKEKVFLDKDISENARRKFSWEKMISDIK